MVAAMVHYSIYFYQLAIIISPANRGFEYEHTIIITDFFHRNVSIILIRYLWVLGGKEEEYFVRQ